MWERVSHSDEKTDCELVVKTIW